MRCVLFHRNLSQQITRQPGKPVQLGVSSHMEAEGFIILHSFADSSIFSVAFSTGYDHEKLKSIRLSQQDRLAKYASDHFPVGLEIK